MRKDAGPAELEEKGARIMRCTDDELLLETSAVWAVYSRQKRFRSVTQCHFIEAIPSPLITALSYSPFEPRRLLRAEASFVLHAQ
jgi:hypothetical protein